MNTCDWCCCSLLLCYYGTYGVLFCCYPESPTRVATLLVSSGCPNGVSSGIS